MKQLHQLHRSGGVFSDPPNPPFLAGRIFQKKTGWTAICGRLERLIQLLFLYMGVSKNRGTPKWMVYTGKPY